MARLPTIIGVLSLPFTGIAVLWALGFWVFDQGVRHGQPPAAALWLTVVALMLLAVTVGAFWHAHSSKKREAAPAQ